MVLKCCEAWYSAREVWNSENSKALKDLFKVNIAPNCYRNTREKAEGQAQTDMGQGKKIKKNKKKQLSE